MVMRPWLGGLLLTAAACGPGLLLTDWMMAAQPRAARLAAGLATSAALFIGLSYVATTLHHPEWTLALLGVVALSVVAARRRWPSVPVVVPPLRTSEIVLAISAIIGAWLWFAIPVLVRELPAGPDASFHVPIIELIRSHGGLPEDWGNYEPGERFDYPAALHCAMAFAGQVTGLDSEQIYNATLLVLGLVLLIELWAAGTRIGGHTMVGVLSVLVFGFTDGWGTLTSQGEWGGIANIAGLVLMFGVILASVQSSRRSIVVGGVCATALVLEHHLTFAILLFVVAFIAGLEWISERRVSAFSRTAMASAGLACATAGVAVLLRPTGRFRLIDALTFANEPMITLGYLRSVMGIPMLLVGGAGVVRSLVYARGTVERIAAAWAIALVAFWAFFDIVYRVGANLIFHLNVSAFTPSRGLTDAAVFMSIAGAGLLWAILDRWRWRVAGVAMIGVLLVGLNGSAEWSRITEARAQISEARELRQLCSAIREHTSEEAVVFLARSSFPQWGPYLSDREFNRFWGPSYHMSEYRMKKRALLDPLSFAAYERSIVQRPVYYAMTDDDPPIDPNRVRLTWRSAHWRLFEVLP